MRTNARVGASSGAISGRDGFRWWLRCTLAKATGCYYRRAHRLGFSTRASRQAGRHAVRPLLATPPVAVAGPVDGHLTRVALVGNGPAESPGLPDSVDGFGGLLAGSLQRLIGGRVEVRSLLGGDWDLAGLRTLLETERLHWSDALVVTASYRPQLAEVPLRAWEWYTKSLRDVLIDGTEPGAVIRVLSLPWREAARDLPGVWGGAFGNRVIVLAETAEAALHDAQPAVLLRLDAPASHGEWDGPQFSAGTYSAWADRVARDLARALDFRAAPPDRLVNNDNDPAAEPPRD